MVSVYLPRLLYVKVGDAEFVVGRKPVPIEHAHAEAVLEQLAAHARKLKVFVPPVGVVRGR